MSDQETKSVETEADVSEETPRGPDIKGAFSAFKGSPSVDQIEQWKSEHGKVFVSGFDEETLIVFRTLKRKDHLSLQERLRLPETDPRYIPANQSEEAVLDACVLWSSIGTDWENMDAGIINTLHEQIMQNSSFVPAQMASLLVAQL